MGGFTGGAGDVSGGDAGPATTGQVRGADLALGGINIGTRGGINFMQIAVFAGIAVAVFLAFRLIK